MPKPTQTEWNVGPRLTQIPGLLPVGGSVGQGVSSGAEEGYQ